MPRKAVPKRIYQLKITLKDSKPPIWRRVEVADDVTLAKLHAIIQAAISSSVSPRPTRQAATANKLGVGSTAASN